MKNNNKKVYLGDSVYCEFNGSVIILTTENGLGASNTIILEPAVLESLVDFYKKLLKEYQNSSD